MKQEQKWNLSPIVFVSFSNKLMLNDWNWRTPICTEVERKSRRPYSQVQELQERMNYLNDSAEFQEVESNFCGKISHVSSQPARIPSPRSMPSCDKRLPLDSSIFDTKCYRCGSVAHKHREEERIGNTIPMPTSACRPSTMSSTIPVDFPKNSMVGQQRQQISELQFDKFPTSSSFLCWKMRFKTQVPVLPRRQCDGPKKW